MATNLGQFLNGTAPFAQYLTQAGDGTGAINANGNYSGGATTWYVQPPANTTLLVSTLLLQVADSGNLNVGDYGNIAGGLLNGITIRTVVNSVTRNLTGGIVINNNWELASSCDQFQLTQISNVFTWVMRAQMNFFERWGVPLVLEGRFNDRLEIILNDNFTALDAQTFTVFGGNLAS